MAEERMLITGGQRLEGTVHVSGGKNTSVAVISASILSQTPCVIENLPNIEDVNVSVETLRHLGAKVIWDPDAGVMEVDSSTINRTDVPLELCRRMRASSYYIGALLARFGRAQVPLPGGCDIGRRPIDQHIKGMRALGAKVETTRGMVLAEADELTVQTCLWIWSRSAVRSTSCWRPPAQRASPRFTMPPRNLTSSIWPTFSIRWAAASKARARMSSAFAAWIRCNVAALTPSFRIRLKPAR